MAVLYKFGYRSRIPTEGEPSLGGWLRGAGRARRPARPPHASAAANKMDASAKKSDIEERALELELEAGMKWSEAATLRLEHLSETDVRHHEPLNELLPSSSVRPCGPPRSCSAADIWSSPSRESQPLAPPARHSAATPSAGQSRTDPNWLPRAEFRAQRARNHYSSQSSARRSKLSSRSETTGVHSSVPATYTLPASHAALAASGPPCPQPDAAAQLVELAAQLIVSAQRIQSDSQPAPFVHPANRRARRQAPGHRYQSHHYNY